VSVQPTSLLARALTLLERFGTSAGHLDNREQLHHLGVCCQRRQWVGGETMPDGSGFRVVNQTLDGTCASSCLEWQTVTRELSAAVAAEAPLQPRLLEVTA
jgi:hypothetical protein